MMDGRDAFLTLAREKHLEFSSLRRCKYSTLALIYELHTQVIILCTMFKPYVSSWALLTRIKKMAAIGKAPAFYH